MTDVIRNICAIDSNIAFIIGGDGPKYNELADVIERENVRP